MTEGRYLRKGSKVVICLTPGDYAITPGMLNYNGQTAYISKVCRKKTKERVVYDIDGNAIGKKTRRHQAESLVYGYELEDVVSKYGVPYTFTRDMLI